MECFTIRVQSLDLENLKPSKEACREDFVEGLWHDPYECTSHYEALTEKKCAEEAIKYAEKAILELKMHIKQLKKIK